MSKSPRQRSGSARSVQAKSSARSSSQAEITAGKHHSYRMHRVKFFDYEPQAINCIACDATNNRLALSR